MFGRFKKREENEPLHPDEIITIDVSAPESPVHCGAFNCPYFHEDIIIPRVDVCLYISEEMVRLRSSAPSLKEAQKLSKRLRSTLKPGTRPPELEPRVMCRFQAHCMGLDVTLSQADAQSWWEEGKVPLRPTPVLNAYNRPTLPPTIRPACILS